MSAFKKLKSTDAFVTTYVAKKSWNITGSALGSYNIQAFGARSSSVVAEEVNSLFDYGPSDSDISNQGTYNQKLLYRSLNQLYYKNYNYANGLLIEPYLYNLATGSTSVPISNYSASKFFDNYEQSYFAKSGEENTSGSRYLRSNACIYSIPRDITGIHIEPNSFKLTPSSSGATYYGGQIPIIDDGEGILKVSQSTSLTNVGNIFYSHGIAVLTDNVIANAYRFRPQLDKLEFKSNQPIYTYNYHCKISDYEYNHTLNPTALSGSDNKLRNNVSGSDFNPYITSVGLYNDAQELIAVGKLSQPLRKPSDTELTIQIKLDI